jgi:nucleoside-diphosphate-sugar epimerase
MPRQASGSKKSVRKSPEAPHQSSTAGARPVPKRVLVIGGTQFIGRLMVNQLLREGHEVYILHRKPRHQFSKRVHNLVGDRNDAATVRKAVGTVQFDAVYDNVYDWQHGTTSAQVEATAQIFEGRVGRYIFMSSVAAYGDGLNHHEGDALASDDHPSIYARNKAMSERALFRMHQRSGFPVITLRPPFVYGPENPFYREAFFWDRFRAGRPVILPSEGHRLMQFVYVKDLVDAAVRMLGLPNVVGHAFNIANPRAVTQHELCLDLARTAGVKEPTLVPIPRERIHRAQGQITGENLYFGEYFDLPPITQIITKAQRMLAFKPTDFPVALKTTYRAYLKKRGFPRPDFTFEDQLLSRFSPDVHTSRSA